MTVDERLGVYWYDTIVAVECTYGSDIHSTEQQQISTCPATLNKQYTI